MNSTTEEQGRNSNVASNRDNSIQTIKVRVRAEGKESESPRSDTDKFESPRFGTYNSPLSEEEKRKIWNESKFQRTLRSPVLSGMLVHSSTI